MATRLYTDEIIEFMGKHSKGKNSEDLTILINSTFNTSYSVGQITSARYSFGYKSGIDARIKKGQNIKPSLYSDEVISFIKDNAKGVNTENLTKLINSRFKTNYRVGQIEYKRYNIGAPSGISNVGRRLSPATEFKKGHRPTHSIQKGQRISPATEFKKGHVPKNYLPIGTVILRDDGYLWKKYADTKPARFGWKQIHRHNWEQVHGKIPDDRKIIFLDGDRMNTDISNLAMVSNQEMLIANQHGLIKEDPEITKVGVQLSKVIAKTYNLTRNKKKGREDDKTKTRRKP